MLTAIYFTGVLTALLMMHVGLYAREARKSVYRSTVYLYLPDSAIRIAYVIATLFSWLIVVAIIRNKLEIRRCCKLKGISWREGVILRFNSTGEE